MQAGTDSGRGVVARVMTLVVALVVAGLCALRAVGDALLAASAQTLTTSSDFERVDLTPFVIAAVVWAALATVAALLAVVVVRPSGTRRARTLAAVAVAALAIAYVIDVVANPPSSI